MRVIAIMKPDDNKWLSNEILYGDYRNQCIRNFMTSHTVSDVLDTEMSEKAIQLGLDPAELEWAEITGRDGFLFIEVYGHIPSEDGSTFIPKSVEILGADWISNTRAEGMVYYIMDALRDIAQNYTFQKE